MALLFSDMACRGVAGQLSELHAECGGAAAFHRRIRCFTPGTGPVGIHIKAWLAGGRCLLLIRLGLAGLIRPGVDLERLRRLHRQIDFETLSFEAPDLAHLL